jgi:hypothetical protein
MEWFQHHEAVQDIRRMPQSFVPIRVHGDDAPVTKANQLTILNMSCCTSSAASMLSRVLLTAIVSGRLVSMRVPMAIVSPQMHLF